MSKKPEQLQKAPPGAALVNLLWNTMKARGEAPADLASQLGITYAYLMALARGERPIDHASRPVFVAAAKYLKLPVAQTYLLADALFTEDFAYEPDLDEKFDRIHQSMLNDPVWCGYAPSQKEWRLLDKKIKMFLSLLYERNGQTRFFSESQPEQLQAE